MAERTYFAKVLIESPVEFIQSHTVLLFFSLAIAPFLLYKLLRPQSPSQGKGDSLEISEIYVYPIKSLRGTQVSEALATKNGFEYDRRFMLLEKTANGYKNMVVSDYPEMTQFLTSITMPEDDHGGKGSIIVEFVSSGSTKSNTLKIPLRPNTEKLEAFEVNMHDSPTKAYKMPAEYNTWFSQCFGYEVLLAYLGDGLREVLFEDLKPVKHKSWLMNILKSLSFLGHSLFKGYQITFADCSPYLIVSKTSLADVSSRLPDGEEMDVTKFRPNIVIRGAAKAWEEDYWGQLDINGAEIVPAHNCVRCKSINIDYSTGKPATGASGEVLKKLQKDRRVDMGAKWSPVFGRYSFWNPKYGSRMFKVGDEVVVRKLNKERTTWTWKGIS